MKKCYKVVPNKLIQRDKNAPSGNDVLIVRRIKCRRELSQMKDGSNMIEVKLGLVDGVQIWEMPTFPDLRGNLFKAFVGGQSGSFPVDFDMQEHFFTVSKKDVFRGMHFQGPPHAVAKVVSIVQGEAIDFLLDTRKASKTYGHVQIQQLSQGNPVSIYIPVGVAHGYLSLKDNTIISYKMDGFFCGNCDGGVSGEVVNDFLPMEFEKTIRSERDTKLQNFNDFEYRSSCTR